MKQQDCAHGGSRGQRGGPSAKTAPPTAPDLPAIAAKADDLEEIKESRLEDAASVSGGLWLSYLFVLSYVAIAAGAVTMKIFCWCAPSNCPSSMSNCL